MKRLVVLVAVVAVLALSAMPAFAQTDPPPIINETSTSLMNSILTFIASSGLGVVVAVAAVFGLAGYALRRFRAAVR